MTLLYQGLIYHNNIPIYDILFKSTNIKIAMWYLIRLYYTSQKNDSFELFILDKIKNTISDNNDNSFKYSYSQFIYQYKDLLSILLFIISNDIINLTLLYNWTLQYNILYPSSKIIVKQRQVFDTNSRIFDNNITLDQINFKELSNPMYLQYKIKNDYNKLILNHYQINPIHKTIMDLPTNNNLSLQTYSRPYLQQTSILDNYHSWQFKNRFKRYNINSLLLDKLTFKK